MHRPDDLQQRLQGGFTDSVVIVGQLSNKFERALLDVWQEVCTGSGEQCPNGVGSDLLLNADDAVDFEQLVEINVFDLNFTVVGDRNSVGGGASRRECGYGIRNS